MPELKSEKGRVDPTVEGDDVSVDVVYKTPFFREHETLIVSARDWMGVGISILLFGVIALSTWIKMERGEFPFNVDFIAKMAYWRTAPGTPLVAFLVGFVIAVVALMSRRKVVAKVEAGIGENVVGELEKRGHLRKLKCV